jgi:two-component system LytT family response regulator
MRTITAVIADDEPAGRRTVQLLLSRDPAVEVVAECRTGAEAADAVLRLRPDLLFLDVQMPGGDGFHALAQIPAEAMPLVVFVTAFEEYALKAFDVHAADYLTKPFSDQRFRAAMTAVKQRLAAAGGTEAWHGGSPVAGSGRSSDDPAPARRLVLRTAHGALVVHTDDVDWIEARGDYVRIHAGGRTDLLRSGIGALEERLDPRRFVRVHRSVIVNVARVREIRAMPSGEQAVVLRSGVACRMSERGRERLNRILGAPR